MRDNVGVNDVPKHPVTRAAKMARLPIGLAGRTVHKVLTRELGENWQDSFTEFNDTPAAAASIGQVHKAVWRDGQRVAVKIQYPGARRALSSDFTQLSRAGRLFGLGV